MAYHDPELYCPPIRTEKINNLEPPRSVSPVQEELSNLSNQIDRTSHLIEQIQDRLYNAGVISENSPATKNSDSPVSTPCAMSNSIAAMSSRLNTLCDTMIDTINRLCI